MYKTRSKNDKNQTETILKESELSSRQKFIKVKLFIKLNIKIFKRQEQRECTDKGTTVKDVYMREVG